MPSIKNELCNVTENFTLDGLRQLMREAIQLAIGRQVNNGKNWADVDEVIEAFKSLNCINFSLEDFKPTLMDFYTAMVEVIERIPGSYQDGLEHFLNGDVPYWSLDGLQFRKFEIHAELDSYANNPLMMVRELDIDQLLELFDEANLSDLLERTANYIARANPMELKEGLIRVTMAAIQEMQNPQP